MLLRLEGSDNLQHVSRPPCFWTKMRKKKYCICYRTPNFTVHFYFEHEEHMGEEQGVYYLEILWLNNSSSTFLKKPKCLLNTYGHKSRHLQSPERETSAGFPPAAPCSAAAGKEAQAGSALTLSVRTSRPRRGEPASPFTETGTLRVNPLRTRGAGRGAGSVRRRGRGQSPLSAGRGGPTAAAAQRREPSPGHITCVWSGQCPRNSEFWNKMLTPNTGNFHFSWTAQGFS